VGRVAKQGERHPFHRASSLRCAGASLHRDDLCLRPLPAGCASAGATCARRRAAPSHERSSQRTTQQALLATAGRHAPPSCFAERWVGSAASSSLSDAVGVVAQRRQPCMPACLLLCTHARCLSRCWQWTDCQVIQPACASSLLLLTTPPPLPRTVRLVRRWVCARPAAGGRCLYVAPPSTQQELKAFAACCARALACPAAFTASDWCSCCYTLLTACLALAAP
jgi:hypothetical protein